LTKLVKEAGMPTVNLFDARTHLSQLVERAAAGEEIVIAKNGIPRARLVAATAQMTPVRTAKSKRDKNVAKGSGSASAPV
jgi:prevent-host-death family protein